MRGENKLRNEVMKLIEDLARELKERHSATWKKH